MMKDSKIDKYLSDLAEKSLDVFWVRNEDYSQQIYISPIYEEVWGRPAKELYDSPSSWSSYLHPEDWQRIQKSLENRDPEVGPKKKITEEYRIIKPNKETRWISDTSFPIFEGSTLIGFAGIARDITDSVLREKKLRETLRKAEAANVAKTEFIANMSHDLKTPMAGLIGMLDGLEYAAKDCYSLLKPETTLNEEDLMSTLKHTLKQMKEYACLAKESAANLNKMHNDILDNVELESGERKESATVFNLDQFIQSILDIQKPAAINKKLALTAEISQSVPCHLRGLQHSFNRILINLISNAIKFTKKGSIKIIISLSDDKQSKNHKPDDTVMLKIQIEDTGIGIPEKEFNNIFEKFFRISSSYKGVYKGLGLGLYGVKKYLDEMQGRIEVESKMGKGSCFILHLPFTVEKEGKSLFYDTTTKNHQKTAENAIEKELEYKEYDRRIRILLVEDDKIAAIATHMNMSKLGCEVDWAESGERALEKLSENDYHIIFMDIGLPGMSGIETTVKIRELKDSKKSATPVIALTGHVRGEVKKRCLIAGVQKVLSKPVSKEELQEEISQHVES